MKNPHTHFAPGCNKQVLQKEVDIHVWLAAYLLICRPGSRCAVDQTTKKIINYFVTNSREFKSIRLYIVQWYASVDRRKIMWKHVPSLSTMSPASLLITTVILTLSDCKQAMVQPLRRLHSWTTHTTTYQITKGRSTRNLRIVISRIIHKYTMHWSLLHSTVWRVKCWLELTNTKGVWKGTAKVRP